MPDITRQCLYFEQPGKLNTSKVITAVVARLDEGDISTVVVASTTGDTALQLAEALEGRQVQLISISEPALLREWGAAYPCLPEQTKAELERRGVVVADKIPYVLHSSLLDYSQWKMPTPEVLFRETLYSFGQGVKVAVEVVLMAVAAGFLEPYQDVIGIGGSSRGADSAIVLRATYPNHVFSEDESKRLRIREILCMPR